MLIQEEILLEYYVNRKFGMGVKVQEMVWNSGKLTE